MFLFIILFALCVNYLVFNFYFQNSRYLRQLNIDKDILSMKNFNIYDPMKRGQGLVLDGQTLAHVEVSAQTRNKF